jgi:hypothetical protein
MFDLRSLARALGGEVSGRQVLAPGPGHSPKDRSLSVHLSATAPDGFLAFSHAGDDWRDCRDYVRQRLGLPVDDWKRDRRPEPKRPTPPAPKPLDEDQRNLFRAARIVSELVPLAGTPGKAYLRHERKINVVAIADVLARTDAIGWHPAVFFNESDHPLYRQKLGCIVGTMTDPVTAEPTGAISRTYLDRDGRKIGKAKTLGAPAGVIRLSLDEDVLYGLCIAEGIETALDSMGRGLRPMWAMGSTSTMAKFPVLPAIESLTIFADHDENGAGEKAAREAEARWIEAGREVEIFRPKRPGDLNDVSANDWDRL